jgi:formylglycine-generating enzyme required for sulfatase activity
MSVSSHFLNQINNAEECGEVEQEPGTTGNGLRARTGEKQAMRIRSAALAFMTLVIHGTFAVPTVNANSHPDPSKDLTVQLSAEESLSLIWIGPGTFTMGSPPSEPGHDDDEVQHRVTLTSGYWLGKYEVTQGQWEAVMGTTVRDQFEAAGRGTLVGEGANLPMYFVSWEEALEFCRKLTARERVAGRLPRRPQIWYIFKNNRRETSCVGVIQASSP